MDKVLEFSSILGSQGLHVQIILLGAAMTRVNK